MSVKSVVSRWLTFAYVLAVSAEGAVAQVYSVTALAIEAVLYLEHFVRLVALEGLA